MSHTLCDMVNTVTLMSLINQRDEEEISLAGSQTLQTGTLNSSNSRWLKQPGHGQNDTRWAAFLPHTSGDCIIFIILLLLSSPTRPTMQSDCLLIWWVMWHLPVFCYYISAAFVISANKNRFFYFYFHCFLKCDCNIGMAQRGMSWRSNNLKKNF